MVFVDMAGLPDNADMFMAYLPPLLNNKMSAIGFSIVKIISALSWGVLDVVVEVDQGPTVRGQCLSHDIWFESLIFFF